MQPPTLTAAPEAIIFDFGGVLDYQDNQEAWNTHRNRMASLLGLNADQLWSHLYNSQIYEDYLRGKITSAEYWNRVLTPLGLSDPSQQAIFENSLFYPDAVTINPDMRDLLRTLKQHYRLAVLSNHPRKDLGEWLTGQHGLSNLFEDIICSANIGFAKPDPEIFRITLDRLHIPATAALFIDDLDSNTKAADALGIQTITFRSPTQLRQDLQAKGIRLTKDTLEIA